MKFKLLTQTSNKVLLNKILAIDLQELEFFHSLQML